MIKFYHKVGKSTFQDGMTLPINVYDEIKQTILFDEQSKDYELLAGDTITNCRLLIVNNANKPIQIRYKSRIDCPIKDWLRDRYQVNFENEFPNERYIEVPIDQSSIQIKPLEDILEDYVSLLCNVNQDSSHSYPDSSLGKAPHKPLLILAVINLIHSQQIKSNEITISDELIREYTRLWKMIILEKAAVFDKPFYHLRNEDFWELIPQDTSAILPNTVSNLNELKRLVACAEIPEELYYLLKNHENNNLIKDRVINNYFIGDVTMKLRGIDERRYWWVNQGRNSYEQSKELGYIWAPQNNKSGKQVFHWTAVGQVRNGDVIMAYSDGYIRAVLIAKEDGSSYDITETESYRNEINSEKGWRVYIDYFELITPIEKQSVAERIYNLDIYHGPISKDYNVNQGYLFSLNSQAMEILYNAISDEDKLKFPTLGVKMPEKINTNEFLDSVNKIDKFLLTAIKTKPFIILAGISGSGKSRIVRTLAYQFYNGYSSLPKDDRCPANFEMVSVKPDWHDSSELIGYESRINGERYIVTKLIKFLIKAHKYPEVPFFLLLDEMNLAPVEQYFAEFLSVMESRRVEDNKIITDAIIPASIFQKYGKQEEFWDELELNALKIGDSLRSHGLSIPSNLVIMGTVNMDETTHTFSRKVLDRAITIEMDEIDMKTGLLELIDWKYPEIPSNPDLVLGKYTQGYQVYQELGETGKKVISILEALNALLEGSLFKIGYRVRDDFLIFCKNYLEIEGNKSSEIVKCIDKLIKMKVLSRIEGDRTQTESLIDALIDFTEINGYKESNDKLKEMKSRLEISEYTSYWK